MRSDADDKQAVEAGESRDALTQPCLLTDVIDQLARTAFQRALDRRHAAASYRTVIESAHLVRTSSQ